MLIHDNLALLHMTNWKWLKCWAIWRHSVPWAINWLIKLADSFWDEFRELKTPISKHYNVSMPCFFVFSAVIEALWVTIVLMLLLLMMMMLLYTPFSIHAVLMYYVSSCIIHYYASLNWPKLSKYPTSLSLSIPVYIAIFFKDMVWF